MNFQNKLDAVVKKNNSLLCIGLDSAIEMIPSHLRSEPFPQFAFNKAIVDATHDLVCAYKPNSAFYEAYGSEGIRALKMTCDYLRDTYPDICLIVDAKRADIASTCEAYAEYAFGYLRTDAVTLNPYLGGDALQPFLKRQDKGCIILCKTSNQGNDIQDLRISGEPLYLVIAKRVIHDWNKNHNCLLVVGATYIEELRDLRRIAGDMTFLVPGVGTQRGDLGNTVKVGINSKKAGLIVSSSRDIIFSSVGEDFREKAEQKARIMKESINDYR